MKHKFAGQAWGKTSLNIFLPKDKDQSIEASDDHPNPDIMAQEIVDDLEVTMVENFMPLSLTISL